MRVEPALFVFACCVACLLVAADGASLVQSRRRLLSTTDLEIVKNADDFIVGQLVGDGVLFDGVPLANQTESTICLTRSAAIALLNPAWTVPDFVYELEPGVVSPPQNFNVTVTGDQYCTALTLTDEPIKYFPVLRYITWASVNSSLAVATPAGSSSRDWWDPSMPYMPLWGWILSGLGALILITLYLQQCHACSKIHDKAQELKGFSKADA